MTGRLFSARFWREVFVRPDYDEQTIVRYIFGELDPAERDGFEERYFSDDSLCAQVREIEEALFDAYVRGELRGARRIRFEQVIARSKEGTARLQFAAALAKTSAALTKAPAATLRPKRGLRGRLVLVAASLAAVALGFTGWVAIRSGQPTKLVDTRPSNLPSSATKPLTTQTDTKKQITIATGDSKAANVPPANPVKPRGVASVKMTNPAPQATLTDGSPFLIALSHDVPDDASPGMPLRFFASGDVRVGDFVVIRSGAPVVGEIAQASTPMTFRLVSVVAVDGKEYRVRALRGGGSSAVRPVRTAQTPQSKDLVASEGAEYIAYADGDITVEIKAPPPPAGKSRRKLSSNAR